MNRLSEILASGALTQPTQEKSGAPPSEAGLSPRETVKKALERALMEGRTNDPETQELGRQAREFLDREQIEYLQKVQEGTEIKGKGAAALFLLTALLGKCTQNAAGSDTLKAK